MILVTGATGTIGSQLVPLLDARGVDYKAMSRDPQRVRNGVKGDYDDPDSLRHALDGVDTVFLLTAPGLAAQHDLAVLDAGKDLRKVVKLSAIGTGDPAAGVTSTWHLPGEQALVESDLKWTVLRPTTFTTNSLAWLPQIEADEPIPSLYGDGQSGPVDPRDIAEVAVEALLTDEHDKQTYTLTGPELLSVPQQVAILSEVLGKPLRAVAVSRAQARENLLAQGVPAEGVDSVLDSFDFMRRGGNAIVTGDMERVLRRSPTTFKQWAQGHEHLKTLAARS
nr:SDR family oxidoreductase [Kibdelosporangium sp. MJ126-NF4]